jgi:hypothetical protein
MEGGDKGESWRGWVQLWYIVRYFVNVTMYSQYNNNNNNKRKKTIDRGEFEQSILYELCKYHNETLLYN